MKILRGIITGIAVVAVGILALIEKQTEVEFNEDL
jgi:hypothetical protein